jgi:hypothetical protein
MKQLAILAALLLVAAPAWAQSKNIHENVDPYTGLRTLFLEVNTRTCPGDPSPGLHDPQVHLLFTAMENPDHTTSYLMAPELDHASYTLNLRSSGTMDTLIDGTVGNFVTHAGSTTVNLNDGRSYMHETIPFDLTQADVARLSTAEWFQFRINGPRQEVQRCTDAKRMRDVAEFLDAASAYGPPQLKTLTFANIPTQPCPGDTGAQSANVSLAISANQRSDGGVWYFITTDLYGGAHLNLDRGGSIEMQMDGKPSTFHTINGSLRSYVTDAGGRQVPHETTAFHVHQPNLIALSKSSLVEFHINSRDGGADGSLRRCVHAEQLKNLSAFISLAARYEPSHLATAMAPE